MKILMVTRGLPFHGIGGMEVVAWDLAKTFVKIGHDVTVLTTQSHNLIDNGVIDGVRIRIINCSSNQYSKKWRDLSKQLYLKEYCNEIDVVLSVSAAAKHLVNLRTEKKPLFIVQAHGSSWGEFLSKIRQKKIISCLKSLKNIIGFFQDVGYGKFDGLIAIGDAVYEDYAKYPSKFLIDINKVKVIKNGIDFNTFRFNESYRNEIRDKFGFEKDNIVLVSCSRLHEQKGVIEALDGVLEAYKKNKKIRYIIVGDGEEYWNLKNIIKKNNLEKIVFLLGSIDRNQIAKILSASDAFLFASKRNEGLPINVLEACASGLPVFLSKNIADKDFKPIIIKDVDKFGISDIINQNFKLFVHHDLVQRNNYLLEKYSLEYSANQYTEKFEELLCLK